MAGDAEFDRRRDNLLRLIKDLRHRLERLERTSLSQADSSTNTRWEPLTNGDGVSPALVFLDGDVIMVEEDI